MLLLRVNVPNVLDGVIMPGSALHRISKEKGAKGSKARVHSQKGDLKDLQPRDPMVLERIPEQWENWTWGIQRRAQRIYYMF